jgi:hypothetical protein
MRLYPILLLLSAFAATARVPLFTPTASLQITSPQRYNASIGVSTTRLGIWGPKTGFLARLEPGLGGGKAHIGSRFAFSLGFIDLFYTDLTASLMHTWGRTWGGLEKDQTYLGGEVRFGANLLLGTFGVYKHVHGSDEDHDWVVSLGLGLGL